MVRKFLEGIIKSIAKRSPKFDRDCKYLFELEEKSWCHLKKEYNSCDLLDKSREVEGDSGLYYGCKLIKESKK